MSKSKTTILVATTTLVLGKTEVTGEPQQLVTGEELTGEIAKTYKLGKAEIASLVSGGHLAEIEVRAAAPGAGSDDAALAAALAEVEDLKSQLEDADKDAKEADAHIDTLEKQVKELTEQLAEATKPAEPAKAAATKA